MPFPSSLHNATRLRIVDKREPNVTGKHFSHELRFDLGDGDTVLIARPDLALVPGASWSFYEPSGNCLFSTRRRSRWLLLHQMTILDLTGLRLASLEQRFSLEAHFEVRDAQLRHRFTWSQTADEARYEAVDAGRLVAAVHFHDQRASVTKSREAISLDVCELNFVSPAIDEVELSAVLGGAVFLYVSFFRIGSW